MQIVTFDKLGQYGRLGNQLFQIAATYAYGKRNGISVCFPEWGYNNLFPNMTHLCLGVVGSCQLQYNEPSFTYNEIPSVDKSINLHGYFQSEKYFIDCKEDILDLFNISYHNHVIQHKYPNIKNPDKKTLGVHVRRGDYLKHPEVYRDLIRVGYYDKLSFLAESHDEVFIFSDDPDFCKQYFDNRYTVVCDQSEIYDFVHMTLCDNLMIANSSFSWWTSYLKQTDGEIYAPEIWFNNDIDSKDLYLDEWFIWD